MIIFHKSKYLQQRQDKATNSRTILIFEYVRWVMIFGAVILIIVILSSLFLSNTDDLLDKKIFKKSVEKSIKKGVSIKNLFYKNNRNKISIAAESGVYYKNIATLNDVKINFYETGVVIKAKKAKIDNGDNSIKASGGVKYENIDGVIITSKKLEVKSNGKIIKAYGGVVADKENMHITGETLKYNDDQGITEIIGGVRVEIKE